MKFLKIGSSEHKAFIIEAINKGQKFVLKQLEGADTSGLEEIIVLESCLDALMYSSWETDKEWHEVTTDEPFYNLMTRNLDEIS